MMGSFQRNGTGAQWGGGEQLVAGGSVNVQGGLRGRGRGGNHTRQERLQVAGAGKEEKWMQWLRERQDG